MIRGDPTITFFQKGLREIARRGSFSRISIVTIDGKDGILKFGYDSSIPDFPETHFRFLLDKHSPYKQVIETKSHLYIRPPYPNCLPEQWIERVKRFNISSFLLLPLLSDKEMLGVINFTSKKEIIDRELLIERYYLIASLMAYNIHCHDLVEEMMQERERLFRITNNIPHGITVIKRDYRISYLNRPALKGRRSKEETIGRYCYKVYSRQREVCEGCPTIKTFSSGEIAHAIKRYFDHKGKERIIKISSFPLSCTPDGIVEEVIVYTRDITEMRRLEMHKDDILLKFINTLQQDKGTTILPTPQKTNNILDGTDPTPYPQGLSNQELRILRLIAKGKKDSEIADDICLSVYTVRTYVRRIFKKLSAKNRIEASIIAVRQGIIT